MNFFPSLLKDLFSSSFQSVIETRMGLLGPSEVVSLIPSEIAAAILVMLVWVFRLPTRTGTGITTLVRSLLELTL